MCQLLEMKGTNKETPSDIRNTLIDYVLFNTSAITEFSFDFEP